MKSKPVLINVITALSCIVLGIIIAHGVNIFLGQIIVGDPEAYDTDRLKTGAVFNLFYEISSNTGYHPEPGNFNLIFTTLTGVTFGGLFAYWWFKRGRLTGRFV
jgi:hypothetical protein